jgi:RNA polymerase sigma-70 factor (ECF subfamily)
MPIPNAYLPTLLGEASACARGVARRLSLPAQDVEDIRQDLLVDLIARLPAFDAERGCLGAFAGVILANRATRIAARVRRDRRLYGVAPTSLDEPLPDDSSETVGDRIPESAGLGAYFGQPTDPFLRADLSLDLHRSLGHLTLADREICGRLAVDTVDEVVARGGGTRSSFYRRLKRLRLDLTALGLWAASYAGGLS